MTQDKCCPGDINIWICEDNLKTLRCRGFFVFLPLQVHASYTNELCFSDNFRRQTKVNRPRAMDEWCEYVCPPVQCGILVTCPGCVPCLCPMQACKRVRGEKGEKDCPLSFRDCPWKSGTSGHPTFKCRQKFRTVQQWCSMDSAYAELNSPHQ